jgi:hypothetical protein
MKASSSSKSIEETDDASSLSERQKQRTGELRFRFRSSALKQSPSSDALIHFDGEEEEEDFLEEEDQLARYVEPPELPTFAMHKVFGTFLLEAFSYVRNVRSTRFFIERDDDDQSSVSSSNGSFLENTI